MQRRDPGGPPVACRLHLTGVTGDQGLVLRNMTASVTSVTCRCGPITSIARPLDLARCHHLAQELTNVCIFEAGYACQIARAKRRDRCVEGSQELGAFVRTMNLGRIAQRAPQACDAIE